MEDQKNQNQQYSNPPVDVASSDEPQHMSEGNSSINPALDPPAYLQSDKTATSINTMPVQVAPPIGISSPTTTSGTVIKGGFKTPPPVAPGVAIRDELLVSNHPSSVPLSKYLPLASLAIIIVLIVIGSSIVLATRTKSTHTLATNAAVSKSPSSPPRATQKQPPSTSAPQATTPASPTTPPAALSSPSPSTASVSPPPQAIALTNQDNGRAITAPVGTVIHINLTGASGYHWSIEARNDAQRIWSNETTSRGDGSISDNFQAALPGQDTVGYSYCYQDCISHPVSAEWHVVITTN